nr:PREDICTED: uncharacterized protein LOC102362778 isoform X1 [Latimeria chalumnae]|eukprot:XP_005999177.1 PREDICTED: uncharacterized protein LOC102362778 isoform X1 [Latimeria chalumnae]
MDLNVFIFTSLFLLVKPGQTQEKVVMTVRESSPVVLPCSGSAQLYGDRRVTWTRWKPGGDAEIIAEIQRSGGNVTCKFPDRRFSNVVGGACKSHNEDYSLSFGAEMGLYSDYTCSTAEDPSAGKEYFLVVMKVMGSPANPVQIGDSVKLICEVTGAAKLKEIKWMFRNTNLQSSSVKVNDDICRNIHTITDVNMNHIGTYTCVVSLQNGKVNIADYGLNVSKGGAGSLSLGHIATIVTVVLILILALVVLSAVILKRRGKVRGTNVNPLSAPATASMNPLSRNADEDSTYMALNARPQSVYGNLKR